MGGGWGAGGGGAGAYSCPHRKSERTVMPHIITEPCIGTKDVSCVAVCPVDCIHPTKNEPDFATATQLYIDPDTCIDCALCVDECPVKAIFQQEDVPGEWSKYVQVNLDYYKKK